MSDSAAPVAISSAISQALGAGGLLSRSRVGFTARQSQLEMAQAVQSAMAENRVLVAEAGTGTGKTYAYLVPALQSGGKVIVSTGTKTLQDQLFERDLPAVRKALSVPVEVALLKGRSNYVCHYHLEKTLREGRLTSRQEVRELQAVRAFAKGSRTGDKADCTRVSETSRVWPLVTSTRENCLGSECPNHAECFVINARKEALAADVVVVNHHLFFADLALKDEGMAELLPNCNAVIFDEAHKLPDAASVFFGITVASAHLADLARDCEYEARAHAGDAADLIKAINAFNTGLKQLRLALGGVPMRKPREEILQREGVSDALREFCELFEAMRTALTPNAQRSEGLEAAALRAEDLAKQIAAWRTDEASADIRWAEVSERSFALHATPFSVAEIFSKHVEAKARAWIMTSATLSAGGSFSHFQDQLGLVNAECKTWDSPFDYATQSLLYVPAEFPLPNQEGHVEAIVDSAVELLKANPGGAFLLCTSLRVMRQLSERLPQALEAAGAERKVLTQGEAPKNELLESFRQQGNAVLIGSQSFWEGVDVPGDALTLVMIDKLPFAPPDDPVLAARMRHLEANGGDPFREWQMPQAAITLKQGAGRLIRSETDFGALVVFDVRMADRPWGRQLLKSLPPMKRTRSQDEVLEFLKAQGELRASQVAERLAQPTEPSTSTEPEPEEVLEGDEAKRAFDLSELATRYVDLRAQAEAIDAEMEALKAMLVEPLSALPAGRLTSERWELTATATQTYEYSPAVTGLEEQIKTLRAVERKTGVASIKETRLALRVKMKNA